MSRPKNPKGKALHHPGCEQPGGGMSGRGWYPSPRSSGVPPRPEGRGLPRFDELLRWGVFCGTLLFSVSVQSAQQSGVTSVSPSRLQQLKKEQKGELQTFQLELKQRRAAWETVERKTRREFFAQESSGQKRRSYIQDFLQRRRALKEALAREWEAKLQEQELKLKILESQQPEHLEKQAQQHPLGQ
jgi:hypothetical protein